MKCNYCGETNYTQLKVKEMRNGTRELFIYNYCNNCNCLTLFQKPEKIAEYYTNYYTNNKRYYTLNTLRSFLWKVRAFISVKINYYLISIISYNTILEWANLSEINFNSRILDVGCGNGDILFEFHKHGFKDLNGIDPFLAQTSKTIKNINLRKGYLSDINNEKYDLIMFNHSFEHMDEHENILTHASSLLAKNGKIMIRMPVINEAFKIYKNNWVQIDAPRHYVIHSEKSFRLLTKKLNLTIEKIFYDSTDFQFLGSIQNENDISFFQNNSYQVNKEGSIFSKQDFEKFEKMALEYNNQGKGDQAGFILKANK